MMNYSVGDTVEFNYSGGSHYGALRQIKVTEKSWDCLGGIDLLNGNAYKNFKVAKIRNLRVIAASKPMLEELADLEAMFKKHPVYVTKMLPDFNSRHRVEYVWNPRTKKLGLSTVKYEVETTPGSNVLLFKDADGRKFELRFVNNLVYITGTVFPYYGTVEEKITHFSK